MSDIREDIKPYLTVDGFVCPDVVPPGTVRGCDNQPYFTSDYYMLLARLKMAGSADAVKYSWLITGCIGDDKELHRAPDDESSDEVDDYYGVYAALVQFNTISGTFKLPFRLWRQPQLLAASLCASKSVKFYHAPLFLIAALVIATSCINTPIYDSDSRRLCWSLIQAVSPFSWMCRLASKVWTRRLNKHYANGMKDVMTIYFGPNHPIAKYWRD